MLSVPPPPVLGPPLVPVEPPPPVPEPAPDEATTDPALPAMSPGSLPCPCRELPPHATAQRQARLASVACRVRPRPNIAAPCSEPSSEDTTQQIGGLVFARVAVAAQSERLGLLVQVTALQAQGARRRKIAQTRSRARRGPAELPDDCGDHGGLGLVGHVGMPFEHSGLCVGDPICGQHLETIGLLRDSTCWHQLHPSA